MGIGGKIKIALGHIRLAVFGDTKWGESHWKDEVKGYAVNCFREDRALDNAAFGGDHGQLGPQRDWIIRQLQRMSVRAMFLIGDHRYPDGVKTKKHFRDYIEIPFGDLGPQHISTDLVDGNHEAYGGKKERQLLADLLLLKDHGRIRRPNFYWARAYTNALVVAFDSTVYEVKIGDPEIQARQERFVHNVLRDPQMKRKTVIVIAHRSPYSFGSHGHTSSDDFREFFHRSIAGVAQFYVAGHDHYSDMIDHVSGVDLKGTRIFIAGAMSKIKNGGAIKAVPGFAFFKDGAMHMFTGESCPMVPSKD
jgi:hypothetical protein